MRTMIVLVGFLIICSYGFTQEVPAPEDNSVLFYFGVVVSCLFAISEALAAIPSIKANSVFQLIAQILKALVGK